MVATLSTSPRTLSPRKRQLNRRFEYVPEFGDAFLALFPHRSDFLWAEYPDPNDRPQWRTESRYPLSDRKILKGGKLYGVRFGRTTRYILIDIDITSFYHPQQNPFAIFQIMALLEVIGLVSYIAITSSDRGGIHLYIPFTDAQPSWKIALAVSTLLQQGGYHLRPGQLELFPNPRPYRAGTPALYLGHRLPLQNSGSYLLDADFNPTPGHHGTFVQRWHNAADRNLLAQAEIDRIVKKQQTQRRAISSSAHKFLNDLNTEIETGWTDSGQTNYILGRIAIREYVFHHVLNGCSPLSGQDLTDAIVQIAQQLPGYQEHCNHQDDLLKRAKDWSRSIEASKRYWPYPGKAFRDKLLELLDSSSPSWNQQQAQDARNRIQAAISDLLNKQALPSQATARRHALRSYKIGNATLDKNRDLWHPDHLQALPPAEYHPVEPESPEPKTPEPRQSKEYHPIDPNKLLARFRFCFLLHLSSVGQDSQPSSNPSKASILSLGSDFSIPQFSQSNLSRSNSLKESQSLQSVLGLQSQFQSQPGSFSNLFKPSSSRMLESRLSIGLWLNFFWFLGIGYLSSLVRVVGLLIGLT